MFLRNILFVYFIESALHKLFESVTYLDLWDGKGPVPLNIFKATFTHEKALV